MSHSLSCIRDNDCECAAACSVNGDERVVGFFVFVLTLDIGAIDSASPIFCARVSVFRIKALFSSSASRVLALILAKRECFMVQIGCKIDPLTEDGRRCICRRR